MNENKKNPIENEVRNSTVYKTMTGSGIPVVDEIARGISEAASKIDAVLTGPSPTAKNRVYNTTAKDVPQSGKPTAAQSAQPTAQSAQPTATPPTQQAAPQQQPRPQSHTVPNAQYRPAQNTTQRSPQGAQNIPHHQNRNVNPAPAPQMKIVRTGSSVKFYLTGIAAIIYALVGPMSAPFHFIIFAAVLILVFVLSSLIFKGRKKFVPIEVEQPKPEPKKPEEEKKSRTGDPELDKLIDEGTQYLKKLRAANDAIPDEALSDCIDRMEKASFDIFNYIEAHPAKAPQIRRFMNYYLPTTLKLLNTYERLSSQSVKGENVTSAMFNISGMMHTVADAFEKQLDSLFADEAMDVSADITVFEAMLKQEGFVDDKKKEKK